MSTPTPIYPAAEPVTEPVMDQAPETEGDPSALGDAGKRALDSMKSKWREERDQRRSLEQRITELEKPTPAGDQPDPDAIRREAQREAATKANARVLRSELKAAATGKLANPAIALKLIDLSQFEVDENGDVDAGEITEAIEDLITREPYLAATARPRFQGTGDGGAARKASGPTQLTRADLKGMAPEEIHKAKAEGRLNDVLGIK